MPQILIEPFWTGPMKIFLLVTNVEGDKAGDERERDEEEMLVPGLQTDRIGWNKKI